MTMLAFEAVSAGYGAMSVLDGVSLRLGEREVLAILGPNGSGKSTALKTAVGLTRMTTGRVMLAGQDISTLPPHRRAALGVGYVPQTGNVFRELSVADNLRMGAWLRPDRLAELQERVLALFPRLRERWREAAGTLSGGERRMLAIASALLLEPRLLLLDEPSSDLAPAMIDQVFDAIARIRTEAGIPILVVEQNVQRALSIADRACILVRGRVALEAGVEALDPATLRRLFLDADAAAH